MGRSRFLPTVLARGRCLAQAFLVSLTAARQFLCSAALCSAWLACGASWVAKGGKVSCLSRQGKSHHNPGFEDGALFNGWTHSLGVFPAGTVGGLSPHSGSLQAFISGSGTLQQSFATTLGQSYRVDFWVATQTASTLSVLAGGERFSVIFLQDQRATPSLPLISPPRAPLRRYYLADLVAFFWTTSA